MSDPTFEELRDALLERIRVASEALEMYKRPIREQQELKKLEKDAERLEKKVEQLQREEEDRENGYGPAKN